MKEKLEAARIRTLAEWRALKDEAAEKGLSFVAAASAEEDGVMFLRHMNANAQIIAKEKGSPGTLKMKCCPYDEYGMFAVGEVKLAAGYFTASLAEIAAGDWKAFIYGDAHIGDPNALLASSQATGERGRVKFWEQADGLYAEVVLPDTQMGRDVAELVAIGVLTECSIGWYYGEEYLERSEGETGARYTSKTGTLREVSMVDRGAFRGQSVELAEETSEPEAAAETETEENEAEDTKAENTITLDIAEFGKIVSLAASKITTELDAEPEEGEAEISADPISQHGHLSLVAGRYNKESL